MTTAVAQSPTKSAPWAAYLEWYAKRERFEGARQAGFLAAQARSIEAWRDTEWKHMLHRLEREHNYVLPPNREPYWIASATAVLFQEQFRVENRYEKDSGTSHVRVSTGWEPSGPFPLGTPSQIVYYLEKGLRLRPPSENEELGVELLKVAGPSEDKLQAPVEKPKFECLRHGMNEYYFRKWEQYVSHCDRFSELITHDIPIEVSLRAAKFLYFCVLHDTGFKNADLAEAHVENERRRPSNKAHLPIEKMATQQVKKKR